MKKTKYTVRKEVKYSNDEWSRVLELSSKCGKLPAVYIREQALNIKIKKLDSTQFDHTSGKRNRLNLEMNDVAKTVNSNKAVFAKDVEDAERIINDLGKLANNGLSPIIMREVNY